MASLLRSRPQVVRQCHRAISTTGNRSVSLQWDKNDPEALADTLPPYPYGPTRWYKQSRHGLYGGQRMQVGNNVGETFGVKTRRTWHPSVFTRKLFSKSLNRRVQVRVTARTLRTIDKLGGLDEYLLGEKEARIKQLGESGWWLRWAIMQTDVVKARFAAERSRLGLPEPELVESVIEEVTEEEAAAAAEEGEAVAVDEAFQVEVSPDLPPLKFRVGPGQHLMLTSLGWIRTRPAEDYQENKWKQNEILEMRNTWLPGKLQEFETELRANGSTILSTLPTASTTPETPAEQTLSEKDIDAIMARARKSFNKTIRETVDAKYERMQEKIAKNKRKRVEAKARQRAEERESRISDIPTEN